jgi:hypothetical protein
MPNASRISEAEEGGVTCSLREEDDSFFAIFLPFFNPASLLPDDLGDRDLLVFLLIFFTKKPFTMAHYGVYPHQEFWSSRIVVHHQRTPNGLELKRSTLRRSRMGRRLGCPQLLLSKIAI